MEARRVMREKFKQILKRPDGSRVSIKVTLAVDHDHVGEFIYKEEVEVCAKNKRTWTEAFDRDNYAYRRMDRTSREAYKLVAFRKVATAEEILAVKMKLWETLKPSL